MKKFLSNNQTRNRNSYTKGKGPPEATLSASFRLLLNPAAAALLSGLDTVTVGYDDELHVLYLDSEQVEHVRQYTLAPMYGSSGKIISMAGLRQEIGYAKAQEFVGKYTVTLTGGGLVVVSLRLVKVGQAELPEHLQEQEGEEWAQNKS